MSYRFVLRASLGLGFAAACASISGACSQHRSITGDNGGGDTAIDSGANGSTGHGGATSTGASLTTTSSNGSPSAGIGGGFSATSSQAAGQTTGVGGGCAGSLTKAQLVPLDIFVMLDQSGSMADDAGNGQTKWQAVTSALNSFVQQAGNQGIEMGLQYFAIPQGSGQCSASPVGCTMDSDCGPSMCGPCFAGFCIGKLGSGSSGMDSCDVNDYASASVPIAPLPGNATAIGESLLFHSPSTDTPTTPALQGALMYASQWQSMNPTHVTVVAFATDGDPTECCSGDCSTMAGEQQAIMDTEAIATQYFNATPSIRTYVIGVGPDAANLDGIANAGGTMTAFHVDTNGMATQQFLAAMNSIRSAQLQCTYQIPAPQMGQMLDYGEVNVQYTPGGGMPETIPQVPDKTQCPANGDGWYYDNPTMPTQIIVCDSTCQKFQMDSAGDVEIVLGCKTVVNIN